MYPDLVRAPGFNLHFNQGELAVDGLELFHHAIMRDGITRTVGTANGHARAANRVSTDRGRNGSLRLFEPTMYESDISLRYLALGKLQGQLAMCNIILRHHDQSTGIAIKAM